MTAFFYLLLAIATFTASFDLIGILPLGGGNLRVTNLAMILLGGAGLFMAATRGFPRARSFWLLALWTAANLACMVNAPQIFRTYAYAIWLVVDVIFIFAITVLFRGEEHTRRLAQVNHWSYVFIALFGLAQFVLFVGGVDVLVKQAWTGRFPRINGFSYEPSYFSTYLIVGWAVSFYLVLRPNQFLGPRLLWFSFIAQSLAMILCSSRMGYMGMAVMVLFMAPRLVTRLKAAGKYGIIALVALAVGVVAATGIALNTLRQADLTILLEGTGAAGTAAHSVDQRLTKITKYTDLLREHPMRGYSLGGIAGVVAGAGEGEAVDYDSLRRAQGVNVSLEILLATGVIAAPLFFIYLYQLTVAVIARAFAHADPDLIILTKANAWGLLLQFFLLQFNQNILRNYFWIQIAIVSCMVTEAIMQSRTAAYRPSLREPEPEYAPPSASQAAPQT